MANVFDDDIATAIELIAEFGQNCFWQKPSALVEVVPGYPTEGVMPDAIPCKIAFFSPKDLDKGISQYYDFMPATEVQENTQIGLLAGGLTFEPKPSDTIFRGSLLANALAIKKIDLLAPNGLPVLYYVTVAA